MKYLLTISIGPVQDFITTARRSRDLWFGSWLLSEISRAAAKKIADDCGRDSLVFPAVRNDEDLNPVNYDEHGELISGSAFSVVNKIVALVDAEPHQLCEGTHGDKGIRQAMQNRLEEIREQAYKGLNGKYFDEQAAKKQVADLVEFYWAACPVKEDLSDYPIAREEAEALLAARKHLRNFEQVTTNPSDAIGWASDRPKSSLDGLRETVIRKIAYDELSKEELREQVGARQGEQLCGVGLLKRRGNRRGDGSFFSTSHVAALPLLSQLTNKAATDEYICELARLLEVIDEMPAVTTLPASKVRALQEKVGFVPRRAATKVHDAFGRWDGHLLFEERLREFFEEDDRGKQKLGRAQEALRVFLKKALNSTKPKAYYALLHADGDRMGEALDARQSKEEHQAMSEGLSEFSGRVRLIVEEEYGGSLVYSGGDDVLAFVPLHNALFCARSLADDFHSKLKDFKTKELRSPTLSVGIAVGHHLDPLQDTLELARQAEKTAKNQVKGKNALAIIVSKRSGADWLVKGSWCDGRLDEGALDNRLNYFIYLHLADALPKGVGYELRDVALRLGGLKEAQSAEALRILRRKRNKDGKLRKEVFERLEGLVMNGELSIEDLAYQLIAARPFKDAMKQAGIDAKTFAKNAGLKDLEA
jgi:CRISPR-associated protein Cmr2